jgi:Ankyrin repeats (many copies)
VVPFHWSNFLEAQTKLRLSCSPVLGSWGTSSGSAVNDKNVNGRTALHWAAWRGDPEVVKALIETGASVNAKDDKGLTALELVKQQLRYAESDADESRGDTNASRFQNVAEILLASGVL